METIRKKVDEIRYILDSQLRSANRTYISNSVLAIINSKLNAIEKSTICKARKKKNKTLRITALSKILGVANSTLNSWLGNYRFSSFILEEIKNQAKTIDMNDEFISELYDYLLIRKKEDKAETLKQFWKEHKKDYTL